MPRNAAQTGFTLIEILVVLVIVGLMASLAVFTMGGGSQLRELESEAQDLFLRMQVVSEQAVMNNQEAGLVIDSERYGFVVFDEKSQTWKASNERLFQTHVLPSWLEVITVIASSAPRLMSENKVLRPDVVFFSSGETTPFEIQLMLSENVLAPHRIHSDGIALMHWQKPGAETERE